MVEVRFRMRLFIHSMSRGPSPPAGSSSIKTFGSETNALAIATRLVSGYESVSVRRFIRVIPKTLSRALMERFRRSASSRPSNPKAAETMPALANFCAPIITFSKTVSSGNKPTPCNVLAIPKSANSYGFGHERLSPSSSSVPASGSTKPQIALNKVVFPAPFGPITPTTSPWFNCKCTSLSARNPPKEIETPLACKSGELVDMRCVDSRHTRADSCNYLVIYARRSSSPVICCVLPARTISKNNHPIPRFGRRVGA